MSRSPQGTCWVALAAKDIFFIGDRSGRARFCRELLRVVRLACRADHALLVEVDPTAQSTTQSFANVDPQPPSERLRRLWTYVAGYVAVAARQGTRAELPSDVRDALDVSSMLVAPVLGEDGCLVAAIAVFRGRSSPSFTTESEQLLRAITDQLADVARRLLHDREFARGAPRLLKVLRARAVLRTASRLCCLLDAAVLLLHKACLVDAAVFRVLNLETGELEVLASSGRPSSARGMEPVHSSRCGLLARNEAGGISAGSEGHACPLVYKARGRAEGTVVCLPVRCGRETVGVLELWVSQGERLELADTRLMEAVAEALSEAFAETSVHRLEAAGETRSSLVEAFEAVSKTCSSPAHAAEVLLRGLRAGVEFEVGALAERRNGSEDFAVVQSCLFSIVDPGSGPSHKGTREAGEAASAAEVPMLSEDAARRSSGDPNAEAWVYQALRNARPFGSAPGVQRVSLPHPRWQAGVIAPLWTGASVSAVLVLGRPGGEAFSQAELEFLDAVCDDIAAPWENMSLRTRRALGAGQQAMAERIATLEQLAAGAAHEIKNPLAVIKGYLQVMQSDPSVPDSMKSRIERLFRQVDQISNIVEDFSLLVKPMTPELEPLSLTGMLEEVLEAVEPQALDAGITIVRAYADDTPEVMADGTKLGQVFLNLCRNGLEAMAPVGGGELRVSTRTSADGRFVEVEFRDTGPGMSADVMSHLFRPFFTTKKHGTGLGLTISMQIAKQHGGTIRAQSAPGEGSAFTVVLPVAPKGA
jgi:signal transduction histidine kinase